MGVLWAKPGSSERVASALNCWAVSTASNCLSFNKTFTEDTFYITGSRILLTMLYVPWKYLVGNLLSGKANKTAPNICMKSFYFCLFTVRQRKLRCQRWAIQEILLFSLLISRLEWKHQVENQTGRSAHPQGIHTSGVSSSNLPLAWPTVLTTHLDLACPSVCRGLRWPTTQGQAKVIGLRKPSQQKQMPLDPRECCKDLCLALCSFT